VDLETVSLKNQMLADMRRITRAGRLTTKMNLMHKNASRVVILQLPLLLLFAAAVFSVPFLGFSLFHVVRGTDADGKWFSLFVGMFAAWLMLEHVATREIFEIDRSRNTLLRIVTGVFRSKRQLVDLARMERITIEIEKDWRGRRRQYLYICGEEQKHLLNTPWKNLNHRKTGKLLSNVTGITFSADFN